MNNKSDQAYKTIGEVVRLLDLKDRNNKSTPTHTIRFWEKEFKQIKPKIFAGNRRYYDENSINTLKKIKYLLKNKGMTLIGVKKALNVDDSNIDELDNTSINQKNIIKRKVKNIKNLIENIKNKNG